MKYIEMMKAAPEHLKEHYRGVRDLAYNNGRMAQSTRANSRARQRLATQMGYLMRQIEMCENAARQRGLSLV